MTNETPNQPGRSSSTSGRMHKAKSGDSVTSLAHDNGHFWKTVWDHPENEQLRKDRSSPNVLAVGDLVFIPDLREHTESRACEQRHRFRRRGVPSVVWIHVLRSPAQEEDLLQWLVDNKESTDPKYDEEEKPSPEPWTDIEYKLDIEGHLTTGVTDQNGYVSATISPNAKRGILVIAPGTDEERRLELQLGQVLPADDLEGAARRLLNLGYLLVAAEVPDETDITGAIFRFQMEHDLEETGKLDQTTADKLREIHGS